MRTSRPYRVSGRILAIAALSLVAGQASAGERYFLAVFASESVPYRPKKTHSFATVVRVCDDKVDAHTISWLPTTLVVRPFSHPEHAANLGLSETVAWAHENCMVVSVWGPFEVCKELYDNFVSLKCRLDECGYAYAVPSKLYHKPAVTDCAHALMMLSADHQAYIGPFGFGEPASARVVAQLSPWIVDTRAVQLPAVDAVLGLDGCSLLRREYGYHPTRCDSLRRWSGKP